MTDRIPSFAEESPHRYKEIEKTFGEAKHQLLEDGRIVSARFDCGCVLLRETLPNGSATVEAISGDSIRKYLEFRDLIESVL